MANFIGVVFATLKKEGIDTKNMTTEEAIAKFNEIKGTDGGESAKGDKEPKQEPKTAETGKKEAEKATDKKDPEIEKLSKETGFGYKDAENLQKELQEDDEAYKQFLNNKTEENRNDKYTTGNPDNVNKQTTIANISNDLQGYKGSGRADLVLPGGKWIQIIPQKDDSYLVRSSNGQKYVGSVEEAKNEAVNCYSENSNQSSNIATKMSNAMGVQEDNKEIDEVWNKEFIKNKLSKINSANGGKITDEEWEIVEDILMKRNEQYEEYKKQHPNATYKEFVATKENVR